MASSSLLKALFALPPAEAVAYMQARGLLSPTFSWQDMLKDEHARAFTVAKLARLDLLDVIFRECVKSAAEGQSLRDFSRALRPLLEREGWWGKREVIDPLTGEVGSTVFDPRRLKLIYDVNLRTSHMAGTWERIERNQATHPYIRYVTRRDERVRDSHRAWDNTTLPVGHPFWRTHTPPNGWRCRCRITSMTQAEYDKGLAPNGQALKKTAPEIVMVDWEDRWGNVHQVPAGIDPGWDYNPGMAAARARNLQKLTQDKLATASQPIGAAAKRAGFGDNGGMDIKSFAESALKIADRKVVVNLGAVENAAVILERSGMDIVGYERIIDNYGIRHTIKGHGKAEKEATRGQLAVVPDDFALIPLITSSYDRVFPDGKNGIGRDVIVYAKLIGDIGYRYVEEIRTKGKTVALDSLRKKIGAWDS